MVGTNSCDSFRSSNPYLPCCIVEVRQRHFLRMQLKVNVGEESGNSIPRTADKDHETMSHRNALVLVRKQLHLKRVGSPLRKIQTSSSPLSMKRFQVITHGPPNTPKIMSRFWLALGRWHHEGTKRVHRVQV